MENTVIGGLLLFGGIIISLGYNKTQGTILLLSLLMIVSISLLTSLQTSEASVSTENFENKELTMPTLNIPDVPAVPVTQQELPMPLNIQIPTALGENMPTITKITEAPNPPFKKIVGRSDKTVESVKFYDMNNKVLESGSSSRGTEFSYQCPNDSNIVGYRFNNQGNERDDTSMLGGLGPVYCADGTILDNVVGKPQNNSLGEIPQTN